VRCSVCKEEILQKNPEQCPYCGGRSFVSSEDAVLNEIDGLLKQGRFEEAAVMYEELGMLDKAREIRESNMGKVMSVNIECPHCGRPQSLAQKTGDVSCNSCGKTYFVPKKVLELF
jgi:DNA-directed RNA polymerase subunit RPC12/RpoP